MRCITGARYAVSIAALDARQSRQFFGVPMARRGIQPLWLRIENRAATRCRLHVVSIDPGLGGPDHLSQPAHQRQVPAQPAQGGHRGVRMRVDQPGRQDAGQRPHRPGCRRCPSAGSDVADSPGAVDVHHGVRQHRAGFVAGQYDGRGQPDHGVGSTGV